MEHITKNQACNSIIRLYFILSNILMAAPEWDACEKICLNSQLCNSRENPRHVLYTKHWLYQLTQRIVRVVFRIKGVLVHSVFTTDRVCEYLFWLIIDKDFIFPQFFE